MFSNFIFFENHAVYEIIWENAEERDRPQMTIWRMRIACWMSETHAQTNTHTHTHTHTHTGCVTLIAFPLQQWSHEHASMLRYS